MGRGRGAEERGGSGWPSAELAQQSARFLSRRRWHFGNKWKMNKIKSSKEEKGQLSFRSVILSDSGRRIIHPDDLALTDCTSAFCVATLHARRLFDPIPTELL